MRIIMKKGGGFFTTKVFLVVFTFIYEILFSITSKAPKSITNKLSRIIQDIINLKADIY